MEELSTTQRSVSTEFNVQAWHIASLLHQGVLHEVACSNKPGLVCPESQGAHNDMNFHSFISGSTAMLPAFYQAAQIGQPAQGCDRSLFETLRQHGHAWEQSLMLATRGVNTHRGMLFVGSLAAAVAAQKSVKNRKIYALDIAEGISEMTHGLCERELQNNPEPRSYGERLFKLHGVKGIRGEVEGGLPSVIYHALPALQVGLMQSGNLERSLQHTLLSLMAEVEDTTVLHRGGIEGLRWLQQQARNVLSQGSVFCSSGLASYQLLVQQCLARRLSPGGCADLLALSSAIYLMEHQAWPEGVI
ncbi:triphosphoribosyl-dephospho-CoA synthase [Photobacterium makurazakiensis]|uniref:triphosphoribosyl-dephospho-CoA synthase n=1 Tax=Photobacterium makurazakiensis TaxID=2910234 RepID=UPI003D147CD8